MHTRDILQYPYIPFFLCISICFAITTTIHFFSLLLASHEAFSWFIQYASIHLHYMNILTIQYHQALHHHHCYRIYAITTLLRCCYHYHYNNSISTVVVTITPLYQRNWQMARLLFHCEFTYKWIENVTITVESSGISYAKASKMQQTKISLLGSASDRQTKH